MLAARSLAFGSPRPPTRPSVRPSVRVRPTAPRVLLRRSFVLSLPRPSVRARGLLRRRRANERTIEGSPVDHLCPLRLRLRRYLGDRSSLARDELEGDFVREREKVEKKTARERERERERDGEWSVEWGRKIGFSVNAAAATTAAAERRHSGRTRMDTDSAQKFYREMKKSIRVDSISISWHIQDQVPRSTFRRKSWKVANEC